MTPERRLFIRYRCSLPIEYVVLPEKTPLRSTTRNISGSGLNLFTATRLAPGTRVSLRLLIPGRTAPLCCIGQVMWGGALLDDEGSKKLSDFEAGVQFVEITAPDQAALIRYATSHAVGQAV
jgi:c-di-GMP-binding flagellar brake protein YcgR